MVKIVNVADEIKAAKLKIPRLSCLVPDQHRYTALLFQPTANIEYSDEIGLRNRDRVLARKQFSAFLNLARASNAALVVCPEYSCPWECVFDAIASGATPSEGNLWVLGCEGTSRQQLSEVLSKCKELDVELICDQPTIAEDGKKFLDPVCHLLATQTKKGKAKLVMVLQFKTEPMGDKVGNFEPNLLILGQTIYKFRNNEDNSISLYTFLCSDVLAYAKDEGHPLGQLLRVDEPALIVHPQLNQQPRHQDYAKYREYCVKNRDKDIICLNWARNARLQPVGNGLAETWPHSGASAIYSKKWLSKVDDERARLAHIKGMYLTYWRNPRAIVAYLNFEPMMFTLLLTKVSQANATKPQQSDQIPEVHRTRAWEAAKDAFTEEEADRQLKVGDGCAGTLIPCDLLKAAGVSEELTKQFARKPLELERLISLTTNRNSQDSMNGPDTWPKFESVDSFALEGNETIQRLTFTQDQTSSAKDYRDLAFKAFGEFDRARRVANSFPQHLQMYGTGNEPIARANPACVNLRSTSTDSIGLFVFDLGISNQEHAEARCDQLRNYISGQKVLQQYRKLKAGDGFAEVLLDEEHVLIWYTTLQGEGGQGNLHYAPKDFVRTINDPGKGGPSMISEPA